MMETSPASLHIWYILFRHPLIHPRAITLTFHLRGDSLRKMKKPVCRLHGGAGVPESLETSPWKNAQLHQTFDL